MRHQELAESWAEFLARFEWQWYCTLTFREEVHPEQADKIFKRWIRQINQKVYSRSYYKHPGRGIKWVRAQEDQKRGVLHYHALLADDKDLNVQLLRKDQEAIWNGLAGFATIYPITYSLQAVTSYVSKYVTKEGEIVLSDTLKEFKLLTELPLVFD